ncbi:MAG: hypothetical protein ACPGN3_02505 [Opitutales bacterium]
MQTDPSLAESWEASRESILNGPCATMALRDLEKDRHTRPVFSGAQKREATVATYASMSFKELQAHPEFAKNPERLQRLIRLFTDIAAYDMSLQGISRNVGRKSSNLNKILNKLRELKIDPDFPAHLMTVSPNLKARIASEGVKTLKDIFSMTPPSSQAREKNHELADIEGSFLSGSPERIKKYLPLNPDGQGTSLQALMAGYMQSQAPEPDSLKAIAQALGMKTGRKAQVTPAPQLRVDTFLKDATAYFADANSFLSTDSNLLRSTMHDPKVFDRSIRLIEDSHQKFLLHYIVCNFYDAPFPERKGNGFFANSRIINGLRRMISR